MCIWYNMDLVLINAYTKFYPNLSICSEDIEEKYIFTSIKAQSDQRLRCPHEESLGP